jgi:hypothetical protein
MIILSGAMPATWLAARAEIGSRAGRSACCVTRICRNEDVLLTHMYAANGMLAHGLLALLAIAAWRFLLFL